MFHVKHRKDGIMKRLKLKELYLVCTNLTYSTRVFVITSEESYVAMMEDVLEDNANKLVEWFDFRKDIIIIKLC